eukprot:2465518-Pleurochrysis_carterae.AAC.1
MPYGFVGLHARRENGQAAVERAYAEANGHAQREHAHGPRPWRCSGGGKRMAMELACGCTN